MRIITGSKVRKILLLASVLLLMLALCGCRTRITNNDEVSNVIYDEEGFMQDDYNMRRDELGLSKAKKPIFTGFGAPSDDYEDYESGYDGDAQMLEDYEPEEEEEYDDSEEPETASGTSSGDGTSSQGSGRVIRRKVVNGGSSEDSDGTVTVSFDANGGTCDADSIKVKTGSKYGTLPSATREGYDFAGWYTKKGDGEGKKVSSSTKMAATKDHKLYAHWNKAAVETTYTVVYTDGVGEETVFEDKRFDNLKAGDATPAFGDNPARSGYSFLGWNPALTDTIDTANADANHVITYTAKWDNLYDAWSKAFTDVTEKLSDVDCYINDQNSDYKELVNDCKGNCESDAPVIAIMFTDDTASDQNVPDGINKALAVNRKTLNSDNENEKLYQKLLLLEKMHDDIPHETIEQAKTELGITVEDDSLVKTIK